MKRSIKLALIPTAIAAALTANTAFAGSEACFEVYSVADLGVVVDAHATKYNAAACIAEDNRTAAGAADLEPTDSTSIAYELTGDLDVDLENINGANEDMHIVYIPTTDIPSGTVIKMQLIGDNVTWANNANQLHLVQDDGANYELVASSDGSFDGTDTVTFLTKAGVTIGAGTRLAFTTNNAVDGVASAVDPAIDGLLIESPTFNISNTSCPTTGKISIQAVSAITDGGNGFSIQGAVSKAQEIADISQQFVLLDDIAGGTSFTTASASVVVEQVEAEDNAGEPRTTFVQDAANDFVVDNGNAVVYPFRMVDRIGSLDQAITITAADKVELSFVASADPGDSVVINLYDDWAATGKSASLIPTAPSDLDSGSANNFTQATFGGATVNGISLDGDVMFAEDANAAPGDLYYADVANVNDNGWYLTLENTQVGTPAADGIMNFNYDVSVTYGLDFSDSDYLDHCEATEQVFDIGVNGAVLKVPYTYETSGNFIRITNEHSEDALITMDIFDESGNEKTAVQIGSVGEHASVVHLANELIATAKADGYMGTGNRHTMTFTVTAPKDSVHGVSVQKIPGGVDRVLPVLDTNVWQQ